MPFQEAPSVELGSAPRTPSIIASPSPSEISSASSPEPQNVRATPLFRALTIPPPEPEQPLGQEELERRLPGYRRIVIPRELTLIELLKQCSGAATDEEVLRIREAKLRVVAERIGLRRLHVLAPRLRSLTLDGSAISSLRDLGIGLVHLKILSVNRCGLTSLDGILGLGYLRELYAAGNRLHDLYPLAALQKLHTLNISDNPIEESSRLWTLGVCGSLRRLTLTGTPLADEPNYHSEVISALPLLTHLDDIPLHETSENNEESLGKLSESEAESDVDDVKILSKEKTTWVDEPEPGPSKELLEVKEVVRETFSRRRPATTEGAGSRHRVELPPRPRTALERSSNIPTRLHFMNTLMDEEWNSGGSKLTSSGPVCGNLARALRRNKNSRCSLESEVEELGETISGACHTVATEIPIYNNQEVWDKFKLETGIDIDIDFQQRPKGADPNKAIERLEQIEKETMERLANDNTDTNFTRNLYNTAVNPARILTNEDLTEVEIWRDIESVDVPNLHIDIDEDFFDPRSVRPGDICTIIQ
ncbi:leucine-rich repeat-containing protein 56-like [Leptidea sinapis]|uniref:leucine-rich repeat-containing protein 56-like n=1 Tax=Leptidea sinapis TaxID=189913 RepID=UPI00212A4E74|nr:leucine-rich repeat-containing protein 56-like [Leptidea sinapis]XP_050672311.1 leucine-rich repeat-containing protein 56-like [Leptidea sinapis]XP_050672312.1 leucine-rich repeat-containing protein 56-like [Leptidea sinapis]